MQPLCTLRIFDNSQSNIYLLSKNILFLRARIIYFDKIVLTERNVSNGRNIPVADLTHMNNPSGFFMPPLYRFRRFSIKEFEDVILEL